MEPYDTKSLYVFKIVVDEKSRTKAAVRLGIKESSLHYHLEKIRKITNDKLIVTIKGESIPTKRGRKIYDTANKIHLLLKEEFLADSSFNYTEENKTFTVFCNDYFASVVAPYLIEKSTSLGKAIKFNFYVIPDLDNSPVGTYLSDFYYTLLRNETIDLLVISDTTKINNPEIKKVRILQTELNETVSEMNQAVFESTKNTPLQPYPKIEYLATDGANSISSFLAIANVIKNTLHTGVLPKEIVEGENDLKWEDHKKNKLSICQYWHLNVSESKSHIWLRKFVKTSCKELQLIS